MNEPERIRWARALWTAGWLFLISYVFVIAIQVRRATAITEASFEDGLWWQRIEQVSFAATPPSMVPLVSATAATIAGTLLAQPVVDRAVIWLAQLTRMVAGVCFVAIAMAVLGIVGIFFRNFDSVADLQSFLLRLGGTLMALGMVRLCFEAERSV